MSNRDDKLVGLYGTDFTNYVVTTESGEVIKPSNGDAWTAICHTPPNAPDYKAIAESFIARLRESENDFIAAMGIEPIGVPDSSPSAEQSDTDAKRYARLRVLGAAPCGTKQLEGGTVLRFQSLDAFLDADINNCHNRGEIFAVEQPDSAAPKQCADIDLDPVGFVDSDGYAHLTHEIKGGYLYWSDAPTLCQASPTKPQRITEQDAREILQSASSLDKCFSDFEVMALGNGYDISRDGKNIGYQNRKTADLFGTYSDGWGAGYRTILAKLNEHREPDYKAQEWRPIETAPKDGSMIWISDGKEMTVALWYKGNTENYWKDWFLSSKVNKKHLTSWMPLPEIAKDSASTDSGV